MMDLLVPNPLRRADQRNDPGLWNSPCSDGRRGNFDNDARHHAIAGCSAARAPAERGRHQQAVRQLSRQRQNRSRSLSDRDSCAARRERRRQVDAGQGDVRPDPAERRRVALEGGEDRARRAVRGARARHRHGVPAFLAVRKSHRGRERRARADADGNLRRHLPAAERGPQFTGCRSNPSARCGGCRSANASASRSCGR